MAETRLPATGSPLDVCRYFDRRWFDVWEAGGRVIRNQVGLSTVASADGCSAVPSGDYYLNKVPLLRYDTDAVLVGGQHADQPPGLATFAGAALHFKFDVRLAPFARLRAPAWPARALCVEYEGYGGDPRPPPGVSLFDPEESVVWAGGAPAGSTSG